jgi:phi13 family phage major tail protein
MPENKVIFGFKNAYYSVITEGTDGTHTYATPVRLPGAVSLTITPKGEQADFYADDILYYTASSNQGYDAAFTVAKITDTFRTDVLGEELHSVDKVLSEKSSAKPKKIALLFEFDGDVKATRHVLYNCTVSRPAIGSTTKNTTAEPGTTELTLVAAPRPEDELVKVSTTPDTTAAVYDAWYSAVYETPPAI